MRINATMLVGAGGIGSHLAEPLARLLNFHPNAEPSMLVVDGDVYEEKNQERQMFSRTMIGRGKAEALAERLTDSLSGGSFDYEHGYVSTSEDAAGTMSRCMRKGMDGALLVCLCVDNDATRRLFYDGISMLRPDHPDLVIVDCGNDLETSTVVTSFWSARKSRLVSPIEMYENLRKPGDRIPGGGCAMQAPSTPQLMVANMAASMSALLTIQALLDGKKFTDVVISNIREFSMGIGGGVYGG